MLLVRRPSDRKWFGFFTNFKLVRGPGPRLSMRDNLQPQRGVLVLTPQGQAFLRTDAVGRPELQFTTRPLMRSNFSLATDLSALNQFSFPRVRRFCSARLGASISAYHTNTLTFFLGFTVPVTATRCRYTKPIFPVKRTYLSILIHPQVVPLRTAIKVGHRSLPVCDFRKSLPFECDLSIGFFPPSANKPLSLQDTIPGRVLRHRTHDHESYHSFINVDSFTEL